MNFFNRHMNRKKQRFAALMLVGAVALTSVGTARASVINNAQNKIDEANENLEDVRNQMNEIEEQQDELQGEIDELDAELVGLLLDMEVLSEELIQKELDIEDSKIALEVAQQREQKQYENMKLRIQYMYESGDQAMLESLLTSNGMADFLNKVEYFNEVHAYDRKALTQYQDTVAEVASNKERLENEQMELLELQDIYKHQEEDLNIMLAEKEATMDDFDTQLASAKALAAEYKETIRKQNEIIVAEEARIAEERRRAEEERRRQEEERRRQEQLQQQQQQQQGSSGGVSVPGGNDNPAYVTNISGNDVVAYAKQFIGNRYVWGGTSLTEGCDCSGFVMRVYEHFGIRLPRTSYQQRSCGNSVSYSNAQPGDIICYSGHVAIYIGDGMIVGAQSTNTGIRTQVATYRPILSVRRLL